MRSLVLVVSVVALGCGEKLPSEPDDAKAPSIAAGRAHACVSTDRIYCWGSNEFFELGQVSTTENCPVDGNSLPCSTRPLRLASDRVLTRLSAGDHHTCGLTEEGEPYCWGWNAFGQLGDGSTTNRAAPAAVSGGHRFVALAAGTFHTCGLTDAGVAYCWGAARYATPNDTAVNGLGAPVGEVCQNPTPSYRGAEWPCSPTPLAVAGGLRFRAIDAGIWATCGVTTGGKGYCWGWNQQWSLGTGDELHRSAPAAVVTQQTFLEMDLGVGHACGRTETGAAHCWGARAFHWGQLGDGDVLTAGRNTPALVTGGHVWSALELPVGNNVFSGFSCGITTAEAVYCWGSNRDRQLAVETAAQVCESTSNFTCSGTPVRVPVPEARAVAAGTGFACVLTRDDRVYCWGANSSGTLGDGTTTTRAAPRQVELP